MERILWTEELIIGEINRVKEALNIDRMPSRQEIEQVTGNTCLTNKISKSGGFRKWARKTGLAIKNSETKLGNDYEFYIENSLKKLGYKSEQMTTLHPYDILVNGNIKIDVKVANWYENKEGNKFHTFNLGKDKHNCDIFICVGLDDIGDVYRVMIIPSKFLMGKKQLSCGINSKYNTFINRWDYIEEYNAFYERLN